MDVRIDCVCPSEDGPRHPNGDTVTLRDRLDFTGAAIIRQVLGGLGSDDPDVSAVEIAGVLVKHYLLAGIEGWTLTDAKGKRIPVTKPAIRAFLDEHPLEALHVGDAADGPYSEQVVLPLLKRASTSSRPTPQPTETSPTTGGSSTRKSSKRSSITSIPTDATAKTSSSRAGDGSTSTSSASAA